MLKIHMSRFIKHGEFQNELWQMNSSLRDYKKNVQGLQAGLS
jgi:hypothetical protein